RRREAQRRPGVSHRRAVELRLGLHVMRALAACLLFAAAPAFADSSVREAARSDSACERLHDGWNAADMLKAAVVADELPHVRSTRILTWRIDEDDRPLLIERAILWVAFDNQQWMLANVYRHPRDAKSWHLSRVYDTPHIGKDYYSHAPSPAELNDFLIG